MIIKKRGEVFAIEYGVPFLETSAGTDENIDKSFTILAESILNKVPDVPNKNEDVIILPKENSKFKMHNMLYNKLNYTYNHI